MKKYLFPNFSQLCIYTNSITCTCSSVLKYENMPGVTFTFLLKWLIKIYSSSFKTITFFSFLHRYTITNRAWQNAYFAHIWMVAFPFFSSTPSFNTDAARVLTTRSSSLSKLFTKWKSICSSNTKNVFFSFFGGDWNGKWVVKTITL